jgi:hypothetical protein
MAATAFSTAWDNGSARFVRLGSGLPGVSRLTGSKAGSSMAFETRNLRDSGNLNAEPFYGGII